MVDIQEKLSVIIPDQDPIEYPHNYVTKINKNRPKMNKEHQKILDDLLKKHNYLAKVAEDTQMKMIQLTIDELDLDMIAEVDQRSEQHKTLLGREDPIYFQGDGILRLRMGHPTRMKYDRGVNVPVEEPLKVSARLLYAADMLPNEITWEIVYERLLLCLNREFYSKDFNVDHYRDTAYSILESFSMTYFTQAQKDEKRLSPEAREQRILAIQGGRKYGELSPEHKLAISNALQGRELSPEHKFAVSNALQGRELSPEHKLAVSNALQGRELSPEHILAQSKSKAKYHFRVTKIGTEEILLEDCIRLEVLDSDFGVRYNQTNRVSLANHLTCRFRGANITGSAILNVSGVDYRVEKYLRTK